MKNGNPDDWSTAKLDEACDVILGQSPPGTSYNTEGKGLPFFQGKAEFGDTYPKAVKWCTEPSKIAEKDDVLISVRAPVGPTNLCPDRACIGRGLAALRPRDRIPPRYVLYALRSNVRSLAEQATGSTFDAISGSQLRAHTIPLAPSKERQHIVDRIEKQFTRLDAGAESLKRARAALKRYHASVLRVACEGWPVARFSNVCDIVSGYAFKSSDFANEGIPVVKIANVSYGVYLDEFPSFLPHGFLARFQRFRIHVGDILLALTRPITDNQVKVCTYPTNLPDALLNQRVAKLVPNERLMQGYLLAYLRSEHFKAAVAAIMPQTLQPNLSPRDLAGLTIPLPPIAEQHRIVAEVERRLTVVEQLGAVVDANLLRAIRLRQSILVSAFHNHDSSRRLD